MELYDEEFEKRNIFAGIIQLQHLPIDARGPKNMINILALRKLSKLRFK